MRQARDDWARQRIINGLDGDSGDATEVPWWSDPFKFLSSMRADHVSFPHAGRKMKVENLPPKKPDGFGPSGVPIDRSAPDSRERLRQGIRILNSEWCVMFDILSDTMIDNMLIVWNLRTGERIKISMENPSSGGWVNSDAFRHLGIYGRDASGRICAS